MMNNAAKTKRTPIITWSKPVNGLHEFMHLMNEMRKIKEINNFLNTYTLYDREITHNACYDLEIGKVSYVYLKSNNVVME